jgi:osmotically-inducible protein OsmY
MNSSGLNIEVRGVREMSYLGRSLGTIALAVLTLTFVSAPAQAQINAIKDGWLVTKIHSEFVDEAILSGSNIDVDVKNGMVTLQGTVPSEAARARAIQSAKNNDGVKGVTDQLRIAPPVHDRGTIDKVQDTTADAAKKTGKAVAKAADTTEDGLDKAGDKTASGAKKTGRAIDDGWIKSKIYAQFMADWNTVLDDSDIDVDVANNYVTLNGTVKSAAAKAKAVSIAKATDGVKGVKDNLRVATTSR